MKSLIWALNVGDVLSGYEGVNLRREVFYSRTCVNGTSPYIHLLLLGVRQEFHPDQDIGHRARDRAAIEGVR